MERNKYNKAARLVERIEALNYICEIEDIDRCGLVFDKGGGFFYTWIKYYIVKFKNSVRH